MQFVTPLLLVEADCNGNQNSFGQVAEWRNSIITFYLFLLYVIHIPCVLVNIRSESMLNYSNAVFWQEQILLWFLFITPSPRFVLNMEAQNLSSSYLFWQKGLCMSILPVTPWMLYFSSGVGQRRCWHFPQAKLFPTFSCYYSAVVRLRIGNTIFQSSPWICESEIPLQKTEVLDYKNSLLSSFYLKCNL